MNPKTKSWRGLVCAVFSLWALAGCGSGPRAERGGAARPIANPRSAAQEESGGLGDPVDTTAVIEVVVETGSAMVVVNRQPVGPTPQRVVLAVTPRGFLQTPVAVAVRFVAHDMSESSYSIEEVLEVTDRPPTRLVFTREGVRREFAGEW